MCNDDYGYWHLASLARFSWSVLFPYPLESGLKPALFNFFLAFPFAPFRSAAETGAQTAKRTSAMAGLVARFLPVVEAFFVANARDPKGAEVPREDESDEVCL